jgi:hypothetical protein
VSEVLVGLVYAADRGLDQQGCAGVKGLAGRDSPGKEARMLTGLLLWMLNREASFRSLRPALKPAGAVAAIDHAPGRAVPPSRAGRHGSPPGTRTDRDLARGNQRNQVHTVRKLGPSQRST